MSFTSLEKDEYNAISQWFTWEEVKGLFNFPVRWPAHQEEKGDRSVRKRLSLEIIKLITEKIVAFGSSVTALNYFKSVFISPSDTKNSSFVIL